jgi:Uma2 family endonuclease
MNETTTNGFTRPTPPQPPASDPFYYGWRDVHRTLPDGRVVWEQIPLTLEDHLHPQEGDHFVEGSQHSEERDYLADIFRSRLADDRHALVLSDTGVYWNEPGLDHHSPDVCVILGLREPREDWPSFRVAEQGVRPALIVEIVSPRYRVNDVVEKFDEYYRAKVPLYVIVDHEAERGPRRLIGYRHMPEGYAEFPPDERGRLWLEPVRLWLGVRDDHVVCCDETGRELGDYTQISRELTAAQARAEAEAQARAAVETRLREVEAELRRLRGEP